MTLDEAIQHAQEIADKGCDQCAKDHQQLAEWLTELKKRRDAEPWTIYDANDGDIELIVVKSWNKFRNRWCYDVWRFKEIFYEVDVLYGYVRFSKHKRKRS